MNKARLLRGVPTPEFAIHDPGLAIASIFRPVCRGRRPQGFSLTQSFDGLSLQFTCFEWLDVRDQSVLLALCSLAGISNEEPHAQSHGALGQQLWQHLQPTQQAVIDRAVVIHTTAYQLLQTAAFKDQSTQGYKRLYDILYRLAQVGCRARTETGYDWSMRLLSYASRPDGSINVALNGRFAAAFSGQHIRTSLVERRSLPTEIASLLHCYLTAWVRPGWSQRSGVDKLTQRIWGLDSANESTARKRRERTREALEAIDRLEGWSVQVLGRGSTSMATVTRSNVVTRP
jgi:hypothetical protein